MATAIAAAVLAFSFIECCKETEVNEWGKKERKKVKRRKNETNVYKERKKEIETGVKERK